MRLSSESRNSLAREKANLIRLLLKTPTPVIADAMDGRNTLSCLRPVLPSMAIVGPVVTVKTDPTDWGTVAVSYTHLRAHETDSYLVCRLLLEKKKKTHNHDG